MKNILKRLLKRNERKDPKDRGNRLLIELQESLKKHQGKDWDKSVTAKVMQLVLPEVFQDYDETRQAVDPKVAKEWAEALAKTVGLLIGTCVKESKIDAAVDLLMKEIREQAKFVRFAHGAIVELRNGKEQVDSEDLSAISNRAKRNARRETEQQVQQDLAKPKPDHRLRLIEDLESQALLATMPEVKDALNEQVARLRRELELDTKAA